MPFAHILVKYSILTISICELVRFLIHWHYKRKMYPFLPYLNRFSIGHHGSLWLWCGRVRLVDQVCITSHARRDFARIHCQGSLHTSLHPSLPTLRPFTNPPQVMASEPAPEECPVGTPIIAASPGHERVFHLVQVCLVPCLELRVLGCGHAFCQGCLVSIRAAKTRIPCPLCRKETKVRVLEAGFCVPKG